MHLCTENIRSRIRSPRSLPSKIHAATPPQNFAAVESLLRAKRAARSSFSWPHALLSKRNRQDQHAVYLAAAFPIGTKWLGALFTYVRHSVRARHSYDLASYVFESLSGFKFRDILFNTNVCSTAVCIEKRPHTSGHTQISVRSVSCRAACVPKVDLDLDQI